MPLLPFQGNAFGLSSDGLAKVSSSLGVHVPEIWTVLAVETSGCGFLPDRRPQILYERHIFHRLTGGRFDDGDISDPTPGGYGPRGAPQYDRLGKAIAKDRASALQSASWGIGQIMGENYSVAGFSNVEQMVAAMSQSEDAQLGAMGTFLINSHLHTALQAHDWTSFARGYNGPNYAINRYDIRLNGEFQKYASGALPDLNVRMAQLYLTYLGFHPGVVDGIAGEETLAAFGEFAEDQKMGYSGVIDSSCVNCLIAALPSF
jgi:N-acetylmuramidase/Putative peptidoglycan binding domain